MKTSLMQLLEYRRQRSLEELLREAVEAGKTPEEIAQDFGISKVTLYDWLDRLKARVLTSKTVVFDSDEEPAAVG
jgi:transposase-like protein